MFRLPVLLFTLIFVSCTPAFANTVCSSNPIRISIDADSPRMTCTDALPYIDWVTDLIAFSSRFNFDVSKLHLTISHKRPQTSHFNPLSGEMFLGIRGISPKTMKSVLAHEFGHFLFSTHAAAQNRAPFSSFLALISHYDELFSDGFVMAFTGDPNAMVKAVIEIETGTDDFDELSNSCRSFSQRLTREGYLVFDTHCVLMETRFAIGEIFEKQMTTPELFTENYLYFLMSESLSYFESVKTDYPEDVTEYWRVPEDSWVTRLQERLAPSLLSSNR